MITIMDVATARGAKEVDGAICGGEFERLDLPFWGGCQVCGESLAAYNMYPSKTGFVRCKRCLGDFGFESVEEFECH